MRISDWSSDVCSSDLAVARSEDALLARLAAMIDLDLAMTRQGDAVLQPFGVGDKADLDEHAFEFDLVRFVLVAILVGEAGDLRAVAEHLGGQRRGEDRKSTRLNSSH